MKGFRNLRFGANQLEMGQAKNENERKIEFILI